MHSIYSYRDYKAFIQDSIQAFPNGGRGLKSSLSNAIKCQKAYLTHVLKGDAHFNSDQAILTAQFFKLNESETDYFLHMVLSERAGSHELKEYHQSRLNALLNNFYFMKTRLKIPSSVGAEFKTVYYSSWHYAAVHMLATIPDCRTALAIQNRLKMTEEKTKSILEFLVGAELLRLEGEHYLTTEKVVFLGSDEPQIVWHHRNWRNKVAEYIEQHEKTNLHTSFVVTISKRDFITMREQIKNTISEFTQKVKDSKEEEIACLNVDFFVL